jgi:hypothetical protein
MNSIFFPPDLIAALVLAILALLLNAFSPGAAVLVAVVAALLFLKLLMFGR